jgi:hypothetical protein
METVVVASNSCPRLARAGFLSLVVIAVFGPRLDGTVMLPFEPAIEFP